MAQRKKWPASDEKIFALYESLQESLISIPGHAEYYRDRIEIARLKMEEIGRDDPNYWHYAHKLQDVILYDFPKFENMPSPETVRVLGEFLFDERGYVRVENPRTEEDFTSMVSHGPVFGRAAESLLKLPIELKPVADTSYPSYINPEEVKPWRDWIEEIKAGKRTFRFVGDPTEYDLDGPASVEKVARIAKIRERDAERLVGHKRMTERVVSKSAARSGLGGHFAIKIVAAFGVLIAGIWYFLVRRRKSLASPSAP